MKVVAEGLQFPEGPLMLPDGSIGLVEIAAGRLSRIVNGRAQPIAELGGGPNGAAVGPGGKVFVCNNGGVEWKMTSNGPRGTGRLLADYKGGSIQVVDPDTGKWDTLYDRCGEYRLSAPNDIVFDADGGFWFTDHGKGSPRSEDKGGLYWAKADGSEIREVVYGLDAPNGVGLSPDGGTVYVSETRTCRLWAWDITTPGAVRKLRGNVSHGGRFVYGSANYQRFDSLKVTASGRICVGTLINGGITEIWPDGSASRHHMLPEQYVTNLCFAGADRRSALVTFSFRGLLVSIDWHEAGLKLYG